MKGYEGSSMRYMDMNMDAFRAWKADRPECVQRLIELCMPDRLWRLKTTGQRGYIVGYFENGTLRLEFPMELNHDWDLQVFGISPDDLEECDDNSPTIFAKIRECGLVTIEV